MIVKVLNFAIAYSVEFCELEIIMNKIRVVCKYLLLLFNWYMSSWWKPLVFLPAVLFMMCIGYYLMLSYNRLYTQFMLTQLIVLAIFLFSIFLVPFGFCAANVQFCRRNWGRGISILFGTLAFACSFAMIFFFSIILSDMRFIDKFADNLKLPEGVHLEIPLDENRYKCSYRNRPIKETPENTVIYGEKPKYTLYNDFQGGMYVMEILSNPGEPGVLYVKANEITKGTRLSENFLSRNHNTARIFGSSNPDELFQAYLSFTIHEGNWGQYYGAHIEIWFIPDSGEPERKIFENDYKIEGWTR